MPHSEPARPLAARLWFGWTLLWNAVVIAALWPFWTAALVASPTSRTAAWWYRLWARVTLAGCGIRVAAERPAPWPPAGPVVYVANHQAMVDVPAFALGVAAPFVFVARAELRRLPLVGGLLRRSRGVFLDRATPRAAVAALAEAGGRLREGHSVLFYPEGTRGYGGPLGAFSAGAFRLAARAGVPVVPVAIEGAWRVLNERTRQARPGVVTVRVGAPIPPTTDAGALADRARAAVAESLGAAA